MLAILALAVPAAAAELTVHNARINELLPGRNQTAAYCDMTNHGNLDVVVIGATSDAAGAIELHRNFIDGGVSRMERLQEVAVPAGETVRFGPGGLHLMLFRVEQLPPTVVIKLLIRGRNDIPATFRRVPIGVQ